MTTERYCSYCGTSLKTHVNGEEVTNKERLVCPVCHAKFYRNPLPAVAALVLREGELLLVRRAAPPFEGSWCLPGGFVESGEDTIQALLRELFEETGLRGHHPHLIDVATFVDPRPGGKGVIIIGYRVSSYEGILHPGDDAKEARFFTLDALPPIPFSTHRTLIEKIKGR